jgi:hypothetical protein
LSATTEQLADWKWRLRNLYWIVDESGREVPFRPNEEQEHFLANFWFLNVILKARQLGFSTLVDLLLLDQAMFVPNTTCGIIAHNLDDAAKIFRNKIKFAHDKLPAELKGLNPLEKESESELVWKNGSSISVGTSMRSGTIQYLHISEYGKIARRYPEKSREIRTGSFNAVHRGQYIFVESTAEGRGGDFYDLVVEARKLRDSKTELGELDWKLHFYPWWKKREYQTDPSGVVIPQELKRYFSELEGAGVVLDVAQRAWYAKKLRDMKDDMKREFPSLEEEAFEAANEEKYFGRPMSLARREGRVKIIPIMPDKPVNTFWDIGRDMTSIWFHQYGALEHRFIDYYQNSGEELSHYLAMLQRKPYIFGTFFLPHDAEDKSVVTNITAADRIRKAFPGATVRVVPRPPTIGPVIDATRARLSECYFHEENCSIGIAALENFRKQWNEATGMWKEDYFHDRHSHGATAFMQWTQGWSEELATHGAWANLRISPNIGVIDREVGY